MKRHIRFTLLLGGINVLPVAIHIVNNGFAFAKGPEYLYAMFAAHVPLTIFTRAGDLFNSLLLVLGTRFVNRQQYGDYMALVVKCFINILLLGALSAVLMILPWPKQWIVGQTVGEGISNTPADSLLLTQTLTQITMPWHITAIVIPISLLHGLYLNMMLSFGAYRTLITVEVVTHMLIALPAVPIFLLWLNSVAGALTGICIAQALATIVFAVYIHVICMPNLQERSSRNRLLDL